LTQPATLGIPPAEVDIDAGLVRRLVAEQFPELADQEIELHGSGWDNVTYRLGSELAVRLPRIEASVPLLVNEQTHLGALASHVEIAVPAPIRMGVPSSDYPWPWSVIPWRPGTNAAVTPLDSSQAPRLGRFLASLHGMARPALRPNTWRGVPLDTRASDFAERIESLRGLGEDLPYDLLVRAFEAAARVPIDVEDCWIHGDLHPKNLVSDRGELVSVIDWGDMTIGDRANDLAAAWMLFDLQHHESLWDAYGPVSRATMTRALGWAAYFGVTLLAAGCNNDPEFLGPARQILARVTASWRP